MLKGWVSKKECLRRKREGKAKQAREHMYIKFKFKHDHITLLA